MPDARMTPLVPQRSGPSRRTLTALVLVVGLLHLIFLLNVTHTLDWRLQPANATGPLKTRMIESPPPAVAAAPATRPVPVAQKTKAVSQPPTQPVTPANAPPPPASEAEAPPTVAVAASEPASAPEAAAPTQASAAPVAAPVATPAPSPAVAPASAPAMASWPTMAFGTLPPSSLLSYQLTGMDKGFNYHASGELRWQHNPQAYALSLSVKAFLLGSRHWRSTGLIDSSGLSPLKFSDSWRNERATHFNRPQKRIVFSTNAPVAELLPGAQDQISLYMQLAGAMAGEPDRYPSGTRLQVQTATLRDAVPWLLMLEGQEPVTVNDQAVMTTKWLCLPRSQYDAKVEIWLSPQHAWMPARIRITQVSGSFIDLALRGMEPLPPLPDEIPVGEKPQALEFAPVIPK